MDGSISISKVDKQGKKRLMVFFNQIADNGLKELAKLLPSNSTGIIGQPITHCQLGIGGIGGIYPYEILTLNNGISEANNGISLVDNAELIHDDYTALFSFTLNSDNSLYTYLASVGNPYINEICLLINYTVPSSIQIFCAKDFNYGTLPFLIETGEAYKVEYELKFGREVSSSSSGYM